MGPSDSGKSTFVNTRAGLDAPTSGSVWIGDTDVSRMKANKLPRFRREHVGFVFQPHNLLPALTIEQNVTLPLLLAGKTVDNSWLEHIVVSVAPASCVGGGRQQRVAIGRALITRPDAVFADERTAALDSRTGQG